MGRDGNVQYFPREQPLKLELFALQQATRSITERSVIRIFWSRSVITPLVLASHLVRASGIDPMRRARRPVIPLLVVLVSCVTSILSPWKLQGSKIRSVACLQLLNQRSEIQSEV
jgi:hypothetical protein